MNPFTRLAFVVMALMLSAPLRAGAQPATAAKAASSAEPIRCWWVTDKPSVHIAEQFVLTITCAVLETPALKAAPLPNQFEPSAVQVAPFEVLSGITHEDVQSPPFRYLQHDYTVRLVGDRYFGQDVDLPSIRIAYNMASAAGGGAQGRDLAYVLPPIPMRIESLVPKGAADIRDLSPVTFAAAEARRARSTFEIAGAAVAFLFSAALFGLGFARTWKARSHGRSTEASVALPSRLVLGGCRRRLQRIQADVTGHGWTPDQVGRTLAVLRVAGALALGRPVAHHSVDERATERDGEFVVTAGVFRRRRFLVSAPTTAELIDARADQLGDDDRDRPPSSTVRQLAAALRTFTAARYGRSNDVDSAALNAALSDGARTIRRLRLRTSRLGRAGVVRAAHA